MAKNDYPNEPSLGDRCAYCGHLYVSHFLSPTYGSPRTHCTVADCRFCGVFTLPDKQKQKRYVRWIHEHQKKVDKVRLKRVD